MGIFNKIKKAFIGKNEEKEVIKYEKGLEKSRKEFVTRLSSLSSKYKFINEDYFEELEDILIMSDIGINTVMNFTKKLRDRIKHEKITKSDELKEIIIDELFIMYAENDIIDTKIKYSEEGPTIILVVGVNGVGKTTSIGKLAYKMKEKGKKVLLVAGDTFRAGATEQLIEWAENIGVDEMHSSSKDPSGIIFDAVKKGKEENYDVVLIDTAGRLQNKNNLMQELEKINRVIKKQAPTAPHETLLVIDATTGQNGISQAKAFKEITDITGIVLTKLDGTAKGGIVLGIKDEVNIPVKFVGLGETKDDLEKFDIEKYIYGLFKDF